jgi:hypothetical protein
LLPAANPVTEHRDAGFVAAIQLGRPGANQHLQKHQPVGRIDRAGWMRGPDYLDERRPRLGPFADDGKARAHILPALVVVRGGRQQRARKRFPAGCACGVELIRTGGEPGRIRSHLIP